MFEKQIKIPSPEEIINERPIPESLAKIKRERDKLAIDVIRLCY